MVITLILIVYFTEILDNIAKIKETKERIKEACLSIYENVEAPDLALGTTNQIFKQCEKGPRGTITIPIDRNSLTYSKYYLMFDVTDFYNDKHYIYQTPLFLDENTNRII